METVRKDSRASGTRRVAAWSAAAVLLAAALAVAASSCGASSLSLSYEEYAGTVEKRLADERGMWKKFDSIFRDSPAQDFEPGRFREFVAKEARPYYDKLEADLAKIQLGNDGLRRAHDELLAFAKASATAVRLVDEDKEFLDPPPGFEDMSRKQIAAEQTMAAWQEALGPDRVALDESGSILLRVATSVRQELLPEFVGGKITATALADRLRNEVLPQLEKAQARKFEDDAPSKALGEALSAAKDYYKALADNIGSLDRVNKTLRSAAEAASEADAHLKKFKDEIKAVKARR